MLTRNLAGHYFDSDSCRIYAMDDFGNLTRLDEGNMGPLMQMIYSIFGVI